MELIARRKKKTAQAAALYTRYPLSVLLLGLRGVGPLLERVQGVLDQVVEPRFILRVQ